MANNFTKSDFVKMVGERCATHTDGETLIFSAVIPVARGYQYALEEELGARGIGIVKIDLSRCSRQLETFHKYALPNKVMVLIDAEFLANDLAFYLCDYSGCAILLTHKSLPVGDSFARLHTRAFHFNF